MHAYIRTFIFALWYIIYLYTNYHNFLCNVAVPTARVLSPMISVDFLCYFSSFVLWPQSDFFYCWIGFWVHFRWLFLLSDEPCNQTKDHTMTWLLNEGIDLAHMQLNFCLWIVLICRFATNQKKVMRIKWNIC